MDKTADVSNELFASSIYDVLKEEGNLIMSPYSVSTVMAMVSAGARERTLHQIQEGLFFPSPDILRSGYQNIIQALRSVDNFTLEVANNIFAQKDSPVLPEFKQIMNEFFHADVQMVDFIGDAEEAAKMINHWVETKTRERITHIVDETMLSSLTRMVLVNAIYFRGYWKEAFNPNHTKVKEFKIDPSNRVMLPMMKQRGMFLWSSMKTLASNMLELPYKGDVVMQVLLPTAEHGLDDLEEKLKQNSVKKLFEESCNSTDVEVELPKFNLQSTIPLSKQLQQLGMKDMFNETIADFTGISGSKELFVSAVVQKAFITCDEEGSEAAATTAVMMDGFSAVANPPPARQFIVDQPFIFYLREKTTGMLLFMGRVNNPE